MALLSAKRASLLREPLEQAIGRGDRFSRQALFQRAERAGWTRIELAKLVAYVEFFSGEGAAAYQRVLDGRLVAGDLDLFVTACTHCYRYDRFQEGYALLKLFEASCAGFPDDPRFYSLAGYIALAGNGSVTEAVAYFDRALDRNLISPMLLVNAYTAYVEAGRHERVAQIKQLIHDRYDDDAEAQYALAFDELSRDYYPEGFRLAEARYRMPELSCSMNETLLSKPRWQGEPLGGKRLLAHGEQGLGDVVMMARYLPHLLELGADVVVDCRPEALALLRHNFPRCDFVESALGVPVKASFELWVGMMSLPFHFDTTADSVPAVAGYLVPPPDSVAYWRKRIADLAASDSPRIGIAWSGSPGHRWDKRRSIPFDVIAPYIRACPQARFFTLQTGVPANLPSNLIDISSEIVTLADTAAAVAEMDLVISVDTSVVHVAGALGKLTWVLLPHRYEWRWGLTGETCNWYDSIRVLRQSTIGDWGGLLSEILGPRLRQYLGDRVRLQTSA